MIINFSVENWRSFKDKAIFTMIASRELQHRERVPYVKKYRARILPTAAIYGGNASGKTNFFQAIRFVSDMVLGGAGIHADKLIPVEPFMLNPEMKNMPCKFSIEVLVDEVIYELAFSVTKHEVLEEKLTKITSYKETVLYNRVGGKMNPDKSIERNEALKYAFKGTRDNQLFLTNAVSQKNEEFLPVYKWFKHNLTMIAPDDRFGFYNYFIDEENPLFSHMSSLLPLLDTGIVKLCGKEISVDNTPFPKKLLNDIKETLQEGESIPFGHSWYIFRLANGELTTKKMLTKHYDFHDNEVEFEMKNESDGSKRVIDLLPAFIALSSSESKKVYIIDEIDRSLHSLLSRKLLGFFLASSSDKKRSQLIFSTHDLLLMDQDILRRDEMWVTERSADGSSNLFSFSDYKDLRYDKDIRKSYLQGRLGGVPKILLQDWESSSPEVS